MTGAPFDRKSGEMHTNIVTRSWKECIDENTLVPSQDLSAVCDALYVECNRLDPSKVKRQIPLPHSKRMRAPIVPRRPDPRRIFRLLHRSPARHMRLRVDIEVHEAREPAL